MPHSPSVTLTDVARSCGVSPSTVSLALRGHPRITEGTRRCVEAHARQLGYRPNRLAQNLKRSATRMIGCVLPSAVQLRHALLLDHLYEQAFKIGYHVQISFSRDDPAEEAAALEHCLQTQCEGVILIPAAPNLADLGPAHPLREIAARRFPCVIVGRGWPVPCVMHDTEQAMRVAASHLLQRGCEHLRLLIVGPTSKGGSLNEMRRVDGFTAALREGGLTPKPGWILHRQSRFGSIERQTDDRQPIYRRLYDYTRNVEVGADLAGEALDTIARENGGPGDGRRIGLVCDNDRLAAGTMRACRQRGLRVPQQVAITGCDDTIAPDLNLTSVRWNYPAVAGAVMDALMRQIAGQSCEPMEDLPGALIHREST